MVGLKRLADEFLEYLEIKKNYSPFTIRAYRQYLDRFLSYLSSTLPKVDSPSKVNQETVEQYGLYLSNYSDEKGLTLSRTTQNFYLIGLRAFLRWLNQNNYRTLAPEKVNLLKVKNAPLKVLNKEEIGQLLNLPCSPSKISLRDKAILEILFSTGLRVSELVQLNRNQIDLEKKKFSIIGRKGRLRAIFLSERAVKWLKEYLACRKDNKSPLFIRYSGKTGSPRLTVRSVQRIIRRYGRKCHLSVKITPYIIRHSFAVNLLAAGTDLPMVQKKLGHRHLASTRIYLPLAHKHSKENG